MIFSTPESRRALRSIVQAVVALAITALAFWLTDLLRNDVPGLREIARWSLLIVGLGVVFYGAENVTRAVKVKAGPTGVEAEIGGEAEAAQTVADAAQDRADEVKQ